MPPLVWLYPSILCYFPTGNSSFFSGGRSILRLLQYRVCIYKHRISVSFLNSCIHCTVYVSSGGCICSLLSSEGLPTLRATGQLTLPTAAEHGVQSPPPTFCWPIPILQCWIQWTFLNVCPAVQIWECFSWVHTIYGISGSSADILNNNIHRLQLLTTCMFQGFV